HLSAEQLKEIGRVRALCNQPGARSTLSPLERSDREEATAEWLSRHGLSPALAEDLIETALTTADLDPLAGSLGIEALPFALRAIGASCRTRLLAKEVEIAARRIHGLVAAIKGFTHMDQANVSKPVAIAQGLTDSIAMLGNKSRAKALTMTLEISEE